MNENLKHYTTCTGFPVVYFRRNLYLVGDFRRLAILMKPQHGNSHGLVLVLMAALGPMVMGIAFTYFTRDNEGRRDYWKRIISFNAYLQSGIWSYSSLCRS